MKEYGLTDEELRSLGEEPEPEQKEPQEIWDGDLDWLLACWF